MHYNEEHLKERTDSANLKFLKPADKLALTYFIEKGIVVDQNINQTWRKEN